MGIYGWENVLSKDKKKNALTLGLLYIIFDVNLKLLMTLLSEKCHFLPHHSLTSPVLLSFFSYIHQMKA